MTHLLTPIDKHIDLLENIYKLGSSSGKDNIFKIIARIINVSEHDFEKIYEFSIGVRGNIACIGAFILESDDFDDHARDIYLNIITSHGELFGPIGLAKSFDAMWSDSYLKDHVSMLRLANGHFRVSEKFTIVDQKKNEKLSSLIEKLIDKIDKEIKDPNLSSYLKKILLDMLNAVNNLRYMDESAAWSALGASQEKFLRAQAKYEDDIPDKVAKAAATVYRTARDIMIEAENASRLLAAGEHITKLIGGGD